MKHVSGLFMFGIPVSLILVRKENGKQKDVKWNLLFVLFYQVLRGWQFDFEGWEGGGWWGLEEWFAYKYFWQVSLSPYTFCCLFPYIQVSKPASIFSSSIHKSCKFILTNSSTQPSPSLPHNIKYYISSPLPSPLLVSDRFPVIPDSSHC